MKNVVQVVVGSRDVIRAPALWRYDREQYIEISGLDLPASYMAEMSNTPTGDAEQYLQTSATIHVPSKFLTSADPVYIWLTFVDEEGRTTRREIICPVTNRGEPIDAVPTPEEQTAIDQAIAALNIAVDKADEAVGHYPVITDGVWHVWDVDAAEYVSTGVSAIGPKGDKGDPGERGETGSQGPRGETGAAGAAGADGFSPVATVTQTASGATISITDKTGTTTADIANGQDGAPGAPGQPGQDGISPSITITDITGGHRVTITDADGQHSFDVMDGEGAVLFDESQSLTGAEKAQARTNIGAADAETVGELKRAVNLIDETLMDTAQTIVFDASGNVQRITHSHNNVTVRTDVFTFGANTITEVRTWVATGETLTIVTNTTTLETTVTYGTAA